MPRVKDCPICKGDLYDTDSLLDPCHEHERWVVTQCIVCSRYAYSREEDRGLCPECLVPVKNAR